jgi:hypothetical protein
MRFLTLAEPYEREGHDAEFALCLAATSGDESFLTYAKVFEGALWREWSRGKSIREQLEVLSEIEAVQSSSRFQARLA